MLNVVLVGLHGSQDCAAFLSQQARTIMQGRVPYGVCGFEEETTGKGEGGEHRDCACAEQDPRLSVRRLGPIR
jgi:hypothetical protein